MMCFSSMNIVRGDIKTTVPCGKCYACKMNKRIEWTFRLSKELAVAKSAYFVTLTYSDDNLPQKVDLKTGEIFNVLRKADLQSYIKRLRYYSQFRYFAIGEYGEETKRPHYHILMFNLSKKASEKIGEVWKYGHVKIGRVETASIHYCTKDMMKNVDVNQVADIPAFRIMSTRPAIGDSFKYLLENKKIDKDFQVFMGKFKISMPRYYRDKLFNYKEKEVHANEMIKKADEKFLEYLEDCKKKRIDNPFTYLEKYRESLIRKEKKLLKMRKL